MQERERVCINEMRMLISGKTVEDAFADMLRYPSVAMVAMPVEIFYGAEAAYSGLRNSNGGVNVGYRFRVIDNLSSKNLPEYVDVLVLRGDIFEIGKEYVITPCHVNSSLWDFYRISAWNQAIPRDSLSADDIEQLREVATNFSSPSESVIVEYATLDSGFVSNVDVVKEVTIIEKSQDEFLETFAPTVFDVMYVVNDVFVGEHWANERNKTHTRRINADVEIGGTYLIMIDSDGRIAARNGAVVSTK
jgi:hypothetical protein